MKRKIQARRSVRCGLLVSALMVAIAASSDVSAETEADRFSAAGYLRVMARPDLDGGSGRLGLWNITGRLLNEGPYAALELKYDALPFERQSSEPWTSLHAKIEGDSLQGADVNNGSLSRFRLSQLYVKGGNIMLKDVTYQVGTLWSSFGDLGLYDMSPAEIFYNTVGFSMRYDVPFVDVMLGVGDSGFQLRGDAYSTIMTVGGSVKLRPVDGFELGFAGEFQYEPEVAGNRNGPHKTPLPVGVDYGDFLNERVVQRYLEEDPTGVDDFPRPTPSSNDAYKLVGYLGFGKLGPLKWNNLYINLLNRLPDNFKTELFEGREYAIYLSDLTDEREELNIGNEMQIEVWSERLDLVWGVMYGRHSDGDDTISASERNRTILSTVARVQFYLTPTVHLLQETAWAQETSTQGNLFRSHYDSVFRSRGGLADSEGFEYGDVDVRETTQFKAGVVLSPRGRGVFTRPSLRLLYGLQKSNVHNAFGNSFIETLDEFNVFQETKDRHLHSLVSLEAEAWF